MPIPGIRGFKDILPEEAKRWQHIEKMARDVFRCFGFNEIRIPILEKTELFARSIGETTDIVEKEMYTFVDRSGESLTLRPEATASILRAFIEHGLYAQDKIQKLYTIGPMFRHERPQKGRYRQFHQINAEAIGLDSPAIDAELMTMAMHILSALGVSGVELQINSLGCSHCRPQFRRDLQSFLGTRQAGLCPDCQHRAVSNPLRVLDCKVERCRAALEGMPSLSEYLCPDCKTHLHAVEEQLRLFGVPYTINSLMVRGLDYYTRTTFEITSLALGAQSAVAAGGRYDGLIKELGGPDLSGMGFAIGMERLSLLIGDLQKIGEEPILFVAAMGENACVIAARIAHRLRLVGIQAEIDYEGHSLKSQMRRAGKIGASLVLIVGDDELARNSVTMRDMKSSRQWAVDFNDDIEALVRRIGEEMGRVV